jgi:hypothetical protein
MDMLILLAALAAATAGAAAIPQRRAPRPATLPVETGPGRDVDIDGMGDRP